MALSTLFILGITTRVKGKLKSVLKLATSVKRNEVITTFIVKQNCSWKIVVRRRQHVRSMVLINPSAEKKRFFR